MGEWLKNRAPPLKISGESENPPSSGTYFRESLGQEGTFFPREFWWDVLRLLGKRTVTVLHPNRGDFEPMRPFTLLDPPLRAVKLFRPELQTGDGALSRAAP